MSSLPILAAAVAVIVVWLSYATFMATRSRATARAGYFDEVTPLFDRITMTRQEPTGFPRLSAQRGALNFDLQVLPDSLTFRKLPALWVMLTLPVALPVGATLNIMARPSGQEPFSNFAQLPQTVPCPAGLPEETALRSDNVAGLPPEALLAPHFAFFADPKVKEMVISPKGLRLVILADEAERGRYLIFRDSELGMTPLAPAQLAPLIDRLIALHTDILTQSEAA